MSGENPSSRTALNTVAKAQLKDSTDLRDRFYRPALRSLPAIQMPVFLDDTSARPRIHLRDQGVSDHCTGYALASLIDIQRTGEYLDRGAVDLPEPVSARMLFEMGAQVSAEVCGTGQKRYEIRSVIKGFYHNGVCPGTLWEDTVAGNDKSLDRIECAKRARDLSLGAYYRLEHRLADYHSAIAETGAILVSASLHQGWSKDALHKAGRIVPPGDFSAAGAHAFVLVGYNNTGFFVLNSWGDDWAGDVGHWKAVPGIAHWSYKDWAESVMDAWVLRLAVSTPEAFEYTVGPQGATCFGSVNASGVMTGQAPELDTSVSVPRQQVLGHYIHYESRRYVSTGSYPDSRENLDRTLAYLRKKFLDKNSESDDKQSASPVNPTDTPPNRIYLRVAGDTGSVKDAMHRIALLRRYLRPRGVYPITIVWTARLASAFAVSIKACMKNAVLRMPDPTDDRNDLIEAMIRPLGRPLWRQMKDEARSVGSASKKKAGPLIHTLRNVNDMLDQRPATAGEDETLPERRIELVFEGAGALVFLALLNRAKENAPELLRHVNRIHLAFPVANHAALVRTLLKMKGRLCQQHYDSITGRIHIIRPNAAFLDKSCIGPYTRTWFDMVNNSFETRPDNAEDGATAHPTGIALSEADEHKGAGHVGELIALGIARDRQISRGPDIKRQTNGAALLRSSVVKREFLNDVLTGYSQPVDSGGITRTADQPVQASAHPVHPVDQRTPPGLCGDRVVPSQSAPGPANSMMRKQIDDRSERSRSPAEISKQAESTES